MIKIHAVQTGRVKVQPSYVQGTGGGVAQMLKELFRGEWSEWLPIYAWVIEHPEGIFVVDTGETARTSERGYAPLAVRLVVRFDVKPEDEIGPQLLKLGVQPDDVKVILTHLHTDHGGGLGHFPHSEIWVHPAEYQAAKSLVGRIGGYPSRRWPRWFDPQPIQFEAAPVGPFPESCTMTEDGAIVVVPTPGHSPGHVAVIVKLEDVNVFLGGDAAYSPDTLRQGAVFGMPNPRAKQTVREINEFVRANPTVYLGSHDADAPARLAERRVG